MSNLKKLQKEAWQYYKTWMKEKTYCPALGRDIEITWNGWNHLAIGSNKRKRRIKDRINKLSLLKAAKYVIKSGKLSQEKHPTDKRIIVLEGRFPGKKSLDIRVILKKDLANRVIFFSVMKT